MNYIGVIVNSIYGWITAQILNRIFFSRNSNKEIVLVYEERLQEKDERIRKLTSEEKKHVRERLHVIQALKRSGLSTEKLVEKYDRPLNAILISYVTQVKPGKRGYYESYKFVQQELKKFNALNLGGADALIPPSKVPKWIKNRIDLKLWFENEILKGRYCKLRFLILFDLRNKAFWNSYLPYKQKQPWNFTLGEVLGVEDIFTEEQLNRIALSDVIRDGDIAWLASHFIGTIELEIVHKNQSLIERKLGNPTLKEISKGTISDKLSSALDECGISNSIEVARDIISEARFWTSRLK
jgi:hypothetical protein